jgi:NADH-quinone oxidoreductase subunit L
MLELLWLIPAFPLAGFAILILGGSRAPRKLSAVLGVGLVGLSAILALSIAFSFITSPPENHVFTQTLWTWINLSDFKPQIGFYLDPLSLVMMCVVTVVGFLILVYSVEYMQDDDAFHRFFAYMNLFVGLMLTLLLADNFLLLYLGWEGVGICSYLLIGFWYKEAANARAAVKAFVVTRVGDTALAIGIFLLFTSFGTLQIQALMAGAAHEWPLGNWMAVVAAALILGGAVGKSAQLPLQTWLPDAMAGPTPVSALIHAATMVTAGVYLIARTHALFELAPAVQFIVALVGAVTLLLSGFSALTQTDIKRVLAYSTISQIGYMFLALGVGAWSAAIFHFFTHAFFKSLLFLSAGAVITAMHHEQNIFKMGGLRHEIPGVFWAFLIGAASLSALPLVTSGFYSKDAILWAAWSSEQSHAGLWLAGLFGAFLTALYSFRVVFIAFFGEAKIRVERQPGLLVSVPLAVLSFFSIVAGFVELPEFMGHYQFFSRFLENALPPPPLFTFSMRIEVMAQINAAALCLLGLYFAYLAYYRYPDLPERIVSQPVPALLNRFWFAGWGFDWLYDKVFVKPFEWIALINKGDVVDLAVDGIALIVRLGHYLLSRTQSGEVRGYAAGIAIGTAVIIALVVLL